MDEEEKELTYYKLYGVVVRANIVHSNADAALSIDKLDPQVRESFEQDIRQATSQIDQATTAMDKLSGEIPLI